MSRAKNPKYESMSLEELKANMEKSRQELEAAIHNKNILELIPDSCILLPVPDGRITENRSVCSYSNQRCFSRTYVLILLYIHS